MTNMNANMYSYLIISVIVLVVVAIIVAIGIEIAKKYELFGYQQNIPRNYDRTSYADRMADSIEGPGDFETASDMPEATAAYTNPYLYNY